MAAPSGAIGGTVDVLASWSGPEEDSFRAMLKPFEEETQITVRYHGTRDLQGILWRGVATKNLPDVAGRESFVATVEAAGYDGWVGLEYKPSTIADASFGWLPRERRSAAAATR